MGEQATLNGALTGEVLTISNVGTAGPLVANRFEAEAIWEMIRESNGAIRVVSV